ncbi:MAG: hypothetical protein RXN79_00570 [Candidatus Nanopusillus sp.]
MMIWTINNHIKVLKKIFDLIKGGINEGLKYPIKKLEDLLNEMSKNAQKKANLSEIKGSATVIDLYCNKRGNEPMWCGYYIDTDLYNKDDGIRCLSNSPYLPNRVKCTNYSDKSFELSDSLQSISFVQGIRNSILDIYNILNPGVLTDMGKQYIHIRGIAYMDLDKSIKENPVIIKDNNLLIYYNGRTSIKMFYGYY